MKNIIIVSLAVIVMITGYHLWDTQKQLASTQDDALQFITLAGRASAWALATTQYSKGIINKDSLIVVRDHYGNCLDSVTTYWRLK